MNLRLVPTRQPIGMRAATGFTLLEVLVAIVVLSFGVLGMVGLQAAALQSNKEARYQAAGARLARELADLMRGNNVVASATTNNPYVVSDVVDFLALQDAPENCVTTNCTTTVNVAKFQMTDWLRRVGLKELPGARVTVCFDETPYDQTGGQTGLPHWLCTGTGTTLVIKIGWTRRSTNADQSMVIGSVTSGDNQARPIIVMPIIPG